MPEHARSDSRALRASPILTAILLLASGQIFATARFIRGDANASGAVDISDPIATLEFLFAGTVELECQDAADSDDSGRLDITDPVHTLGFLFLSTGAIPAPGPFQCGLDPTTDEISCAVFGPCPSGPPRAPIPDGHPRATGSLTILLEGEADPGTELSITGGRFPVSTMVETSGRFAVEASLFENRLHRLRLVSTNDGGERSPPVTVEIIQDGEAPVLHVDEPLDGAEVTEAFATIAGRVSDRLSGFDGLAVTVDGEPANVAIGIGTNGTFERAGVPLVVGQNRITISARDAHGNAIDPPITIDVERIEPPFGASVIEKPAGSGDQQKAAIYQELPAPLAVRAVDGSGGPIAGAEVRFRVTRSDGLLARARGAYDDAMRDLLVTTDPEGFARVYWRLGGDAGCGNHRLVVTSTGMFGELRFCATALPGPATQINVGSGDGQRVEAGAPAPEPLRAWVSDGCNGIGGIDVTFTVRRGSGRVAGESSVTRTTGPTGHVSVDFTLGPEHGEQTVEASFEGMPGRPNPPAVFSAFGVERRDGSPTSFSGVVLDNSSQPVGGAACALRLPSGVLFEAETDTDGRFRFADLPEAGPVDLFVQGLVARTLGGRPIPPGSFPALHFEPILVPNAENILPMPVLLPPLDPRNARQYSTTEETILTVEGVEGLEMRIAPGSMTLANGTPAPAGTVVALNQVHHDALPMPLPDGASPPFAWTLQPAGATFDPPIAVTYPNMSGLPPGAVAYFLTFDHETQKFEIVSSGSVSEDGATIHTDRGSGLTLAGWGCNCPPYSVTGECADCRRTSFFEVGRQVLRLANDVARELLDLAPVVRCISTTVAAYDDCRSAYDAAKADGAMSAADVSMVVACIESTKSAILECADNLVGKGSTLGRLAASGRVATQTIDTSIDIALENGCFSRGAQTALRVAGLFNNLTGRLLSLTDKMTAKETVAFLACEKLDLIRDFLLVVDAAKEARRLPARGAALEIAGIEGAGELDDEEVLAQLDRLFAELGTEVAAFADESGLDDIGPDDAELGEVTTEMETILGEFGEPDLAGFLVNVGGRTVEADADGSFRIPNIAVVDRSPVDFIGDDFLRLTGVRETPAGTLYALSDVFQVSAGEVLTIPEVTITTTPPPFPTALEVIAPERLLRPAESTQLTVTGTLGDGSTIDLTARESWTVYRTSNPRVATVGLDGLVTATGIGRVFITAVNEGATAVARIEVVEDRVSITITGRVKDEDGSPVAGATITSSAGGEVSSGADGLFSLSVEAGLGLPLSIFASFETEEESLSGTTTTGPILEGGIIDVGTLVLRPYPLVEGFELIGVNHEGYAEYRHVGTEELVGTGLIFVLLRGDGPGGLITFEMGSPETECGRDSSEGPVREVRLRPFLIAKHECSQRAWLEVMGTNPSWFRSGGGGSPFLPPELRIDEAWLDLPVERVSWFDIQEFEEATGLVLPSEAQWEYACRGGRSTPFSTGDTLDSSTEANFFGVDTTCGYALGETLIQRTNLVAALNTNPFGLHNVHGNVWEWCEDVYEAGFYSTPESTEIDPVARNELNVSRVLRGGAYNSGPAHCRSAYRSSAGLTFRGSIGFRPVKPLHPAE